VLVNLERVSEWRSKQASKQASSLTRTHRSGAYQDVRVLLNVGRVLIFADKELVAFQLEPAVSPLLACTSR
jgi:hypothetical protein